MDIKKAVMYGLFVAGLTAGIADTANAQSNNESPSAAAIAFAEGTSDLMTQTVVAALVQEIKETTPANAAQGSQSISLIFDDDNPSLRLVGVNEPLRDNDYPRDDFE